MSLSLNVTLEQWPIAGTFAIARGAKSVADVIVAGVTDGRLTGRGECVPYARYGETADSVMAQIRTTAGVADRHELARRLTPGAARNAVDCALWDFEAKSAMRSAAHLAGLAGMRPVLTCYTLSLASAGEMADAAARMAHMPLLKLKLGGGSEDAARMHAVRRARPQARLIGDANEAWSADEVAGLLQAAAEAGVELIEQPLPVDGDRVLGSIPHAVPVCADEAAHVSDDPRRLVDRYDAVNIKLDKTGGLTEALKMRAAARACGLKVMVGCMVATSLAMAPALILAQDADWVDLDGPLLLARDRAPSLCYRDGYIDPAPAELWG